MSSIVVPLCWSLISLIQDIAYGDGLIMFLFMLKVLFFVYSIGCTLIFELVDSFCNIRSNIRVRRAVPYGLRLICRSLFLITRYIFTIRYSSFLFCTTFYKAVSVLCRYECLWGRLFTSRASVHFGLCGSELFSSFDCIFLSTSYRVRV